MIQNRGPSSAFVTNLYRPLSRHPDDDKLENWDVAALKYELDVRGLSTSGNKRDLYDRLKEYEDSFEYENTGRRYYSKLTFWDTEFVDVESLEDNRETCKGTMENGELCESKSCYHSIYCPEHLDQASLLRRLFKSPEKYKKRILELDERVKVFKERVSLETLMLERIEEKEHIEYEKEQAENDKLWKARKPKLRVIAKRVFSNINEFGIDAWGTLSFSANGRSLHYDDVLTRSNKSIEEEMKEDKNRPPTPRCSVRGCSRYAGAGSDVCNGHWNARHGGA